MINLRSQPCTIHYADKNLSPDPKWRERPGIIRAKGYGRKKGPANVLVETDIGMVVVPYGNVDLRRRG